MNKEIKQIIKEKFKHYSNKRLVERLNKRFKQDLNDDDEVFELFERFNTQQFDLRIGDDEYHINGLTIETDKGNLLRKAKLQEVKE